MNGLALGTSSASSNPHFTEKGAAGDDLHAADLTAIPQTVPRTGRPIQSVSHTGSRRSRDTVEEVAHGNGTGATLDEQPSSGVQQRETDGIATARAGLRFCGHVHKSHHTPAAMVCTRRNIGILSHRLRID